MGFSDDLKAVSFERSCNVKGLAEEMGDADGADFLTAIDSPENIPAGAIMRAIARGGYGGKAGVRSIKMHREQACACFVGEAS